MTTDGTNNVASNSISDYELAQASARGDMQAFETIYKRHHRRVYSLCLRMVANATDPGGIRIEIFQFGADSLQGQAIASWKQP